MKLFSVMGGNIKEPDIFIFSNKKTATAYVRKKNDEMADNRSLDVICYRVKPIELDEKANEIPLKSTNEVQLKDAVPLAEYVKSYIDLEFIEEVRDSALNFFSKQEVYFLHQEYTKINDFDVLRNGGTYYIKIYDDLYGHIKVRKTGKVSVENILAVKKLSDNEYLVYQGTVSTMYLLKGLKASVKTWFLNNIL